jgi:hypothetical protein
MIPAVATFTVVVFHNMSYTMDVTYLRTKFHSLSFSGSLILVTKLCISQRIF